MRLTVLILLTALLHVSARSTAQHVTLRSKQLTLGQVFVEISKQTGYRYLWFAKNVSSQHPVEVSLLEAPLATALDRILDGLPLSYTIEDKVILIREASAQSNTTNRHPRQVGAGSERSAAESNGYLILALPEVRGKIVDSLGNPLSGASVRVLDAEGKRTSLQTQTDRNGEFVLRNVPEDATIEISYMGYITQSIPARANVGVVAIREMSSALEEVIINKGYYTESKRLSTGNVARVTAEEIAGQPVSNPLKALQGRMAGVQIIEPSGIPGASMQILIRGRNSIARPGYPLYIIDGVPVSSEPLPTDGSALGRGGLADSPGIDPLNTVNPSSIESIEILKDADATAIYGSRGANGVVLITTKKGSKEKKGFEINVQQGAGSVSTMLELLNTRQYLEMRREAFANDGATPTIANAPDLLVWDTVRYTNWQKELFGNTASYTDVQAALSGGNNQTNFRIGTNLLRETSVFKGDFSYDKVTTLLNLNHASLNRKFQVSLSVNYGIDNNDLFGTGGYGDVVKAAYMLPPNAPSLYDEEGMLNWSLDESGVNTFENPASFLERKEVIKTSNLVSSAVLSYEILPRLLFKTNLGYSNMQLEDNSIFPLSSENPLNINLGFADNFTLISSRNSRSWIMEPQFSYSYVGKESLLEVLIGTSFQENGSNMRQTAGWTYFSDDLLGNLNAAGSITGQEDYNRYRYNALFGRFGYNWKGKYLINLTGRRDGSSRFAPKKQFANFGAIGAAWLFSEERYITANIPFISFGKLRTSYGITGSDNIGDYGYLDIYSAITGNFRGDGGVYPTQLSSTKYHWESNKKLELALELGVFRNRLLLTSSWYLNRSSNQLVGLPLPSITGFNQVQANLPATVQNRGMEFEIATQNINTRTFSWSTAFNLSIPRNKLLQFPNFEASPYANSYIIGKPLSTLKAYRYEGVNAVTGLHQVSDVNNDEIFNLADQVLLVGRDRKYFGGLHNSLQYKRWSMAFMLEFVNQLQQGYFVATSYYPPGFFSTSSGNIPVAVFERRWRKEGDITDVQKFTQSFSNYNPYSHASVSNANYVDGSFIRLKNVSISYQLSGNKRINTRIYAQAQNLYTWTNYWGSDPQHPYGLPTLRIVTGGVRLDF